MAVAGLYKRLLSSPPAIEFASPQGKQLFNEALEGGTMEGFFKLISYYYQTQSKPANCGLAALSVVLNAQSIDPERTWKGKSQETEDLAEAMIELAEAWEVPATSGVLGTREVQAEASTKATKDVVMIDQGLEAGNEQDTRDV
ncbi:hypothetical protein LWI28_013522 [Acer negundo]|uniref:glutathione gamma-glutamylcysteinyltransferase n=1 Tax=Acer negundo TaxID=4023 RepID=A0AAD5NV12_ACENE|nr:hypothetical protein LWI28_013522 [Acer negundo]